MATEQQRRRDLKREIEEQAKRLSNHGYRTSYYDPNDCQEWPLDEPIDDEIESAMVQLNSAICALDSAIIATKRRYRQRVLAWLLAETEAERGL